MDCKYLINMAVREYPQNTALVHRGRRYTFAELNDRVNRLANALLEIGVKKGDRAAILLENCAEFIEIDLALSKTGIVRVPLNARLGVPDHEYMVNDSSASLLIFGEKFRDLVGSMKARLESVKQCICVSQVPGGEQALDALSYEDLIENSSVDEPSSDIDEDDLHTLFYSSGTTGKPKGIMLSQKSWANTTINLVLNYGPITERDVILNVQPLSHGAGFFVLPFFIKGAANVLVEFKPSLVFQTIQDEKVTVLKLVPVMLKRLLEAPDKRDYDLSSLNHIIYGGSPIGRPLLIEGIRFFGARKLAQLYGQGEIPMAITTLSREDNDIHGTEEELKRLDSAGKPCINEEVKIVDEKGAEVPPGKIGEVVARGYHRMLGYWNLPEATAETLKEGWVYTGDMGYMDAKGYVFLVARKKDMIISGAFNIYPAEVESVIVTHPAVEEAAVIGVPDEDWGETVKAVVVAKQGAQVTEQDIIQFCKTKGLTFRAPKSVDFVHDIPRNPYAKVDKNALRKPYWEGYERDIH